jgi:Skp family chaperone for outer membrane proteins
MERKIEDYNNSLIKVMNLMSITRKYKVVGSANLRTSEFIQDFDVDEMFKTKGDEQKILDSLTAKFKRIFNDAHKNPALFITDFKAGMDPSYSEDDDRFKLRWNKEDMKNGYKILGNGEKKFFRDCLMEKTRLKLDMVYLLDGEYIEISEMYRLNINGRKNYDDANIVEELKKEIEKYKKEGNYYKVLKREFSLLRHQDKNKKRQIKLINLFNSNAGLLNNLINQLKIIQNVCIQTFRKPKLDDVRSNLQSIKFKLSSVYEIYHPNFSNKIDLICKKPLSKIYDSLAPIISMLETQLNKYVKYI